ncbi:hypothetical protein AB6A40_003767 [Gnathostoma spinigerum]|uniref:maleylacetoacetate isomerase n=1 Tax=Gnathostoma spinigerum TaxID=75299 RepID=A0ABD6EAN5_9BILA
MAAKPILYSYWRSSCSWRVRAALELKGIEYECKTINLVENDQVAKEYLRMNPVGYVPTFVHKNAVIFESLAILEYLEEAFPDRQALLPKDPIGRATVRAIALQIIAGIQPLQNLKVLKTINADYGGPSARASWAIRWIERGFEGLEKHLEKTSGKYCYGDEITIADVCLVPQVYNAKR